MKRKKIGSFICYAASLAFTWVLVGQIIQSKLSIDILLPVNGIVEKTIEVATPRPRSDLKDQELRIYLHGNQDYFRLMDIYGYNRFLSKIKSGDTALIYIRPRWLVAFGLGNRNDIYQMSINGETIFYISETRKNIHGIIIISAIAIPLFFGLGRWLSISARKYKPEANSYLLKK